MGSGRAGSALGPKIVALAICGYGVFAGLHIVDPEMTVRICFLRIADPLLGIAGTQNDGGFAQPFAGEGVDYRALHPRDGSRRGRRSLGEEQGCDRKKQIHCSLFFSVSASPAEIIWTVTDSRPLGAMVTEAAWLERALRSS